MPLCGGLIQTHRQSVRVPYLRQLLLSGESDLEAFEDGLLVSDVGRVVDRGGLNGYSRS